MSEAKPHIAQKSPFQAKVEAGKTYFWCSCGLSSRQPFCDGTHKKDANFAPIKWQAEKTEEIWLCGCKNTGNRPLCDGSHAKLP